MSPDAHVILQALATVEPGTALTPAEVNRRIHGGEGLPLAAVQRALTDLRTAGLADRRKDYTRPARARWVRVYWATNAGRQAAA